MLSAITALTMLVLSLAPQSVAQDAEAPIRMGETQLAQATEFTLLMPSEYLPEKADPIAIEESSEAPDEEQKSPNIWGVNMSDEEIETLISACDEYDIDIKVALRVIEEESQFTRDARSMVDSRDWGYFQIRDSNHKWLQEATGYDPKEPIGNIICGVYMLNYCRELYGPSLRSTLTAYRWGSDNGRYGYADTIMADMDKYDI